MNNPLENGEMIYLSAGWAIVRCLDPVETGDVVYWVNHDTVTKESYSRLSGRDPLPSETDGK